jgi:hypothetical protein
MAARVLHFGWDECYRVQVLRSVGLEVKESDSLDRLSLDLKGNKPIDAVVVSEDDCRSAERVADLVRRHCAAPLILFRRHGDGLDQSKFDRVYASFAPPQVWVGETTALIESGQRSGGRV